MNKLSRLTAAIIAFAVSLTGVVIEATPASANILPVASVQQVPANGATLGRSSIFETPTIGVETWAYTSADCNHPITLVSVGASKSAHNAEFAITAPSCQGNLSLRALIGGVPYTLQSAASLVAGTPEFVAASYDGTTLALYLNGSVVASQVVTGFIGPFDGVSGAGIGRNYDTYSGSFPGTVWATKFYSAGLTQSQIQTDQATGPSTPPGPTALASVLGAVGVTVTSPGLSTTNSSVVANPNTLSGEILADTPLAFYRLNEVAGTVAYDNSGNAINGSYPAGGSQTLGSTSLTPENDFSLSLADIAGSTGIAPVSIPVSASLQPNNITVEATINPTPVSVGGGVHDIIFMGYTGSSPYGVLRLFLNNGILVANVSAGTTALTIATGSTIAIAGVPIHVALTYDGANIRLYANGSQIAVTAATGALFGWNAGTKIGSDSAGGYHFGGNIQDVAFFGSALTPARIQAHANAALGFTTPLLSDHNATIAIGATMPQARMIGWSDFTYLPTNLTTTQYQALARNVQYSSRVASSQLALVHQYGIKAGFYTDPNRICSAVASGQSTAAFCQSANYSETNFTHEADYAHDCAGNRVYIPSADHHNTFTEVRNKSLAADLNTNIIDPQKSLGYDYVLSDNFFDKSTGPGAISITSPGSGTPPVPAPYCGWSLASQIQGSRQTISAQDLPTDFNGNVNATWSNGILPSTNAFAGQCEDCFASSQFPRSYNGLWQPQEDALIATNKLGKIFNLFSHGYNWAMDNNAQRYMLASVLMNYGPNVAWTYDFGTSNTLGANGTNKYPDVLPEINVVPTNPVIPGSVISASSQERVGEVYAREWRDVGLYGKAIGACVSIVNPDNNHAANMPPQFLVGYNNQLVINNYGGSIGAYLGGIPELGGTGTVTETALGSGVPTTLGATDAIIICQ